MPSDIKIRGSCRNWRCKICGEIHVSYEKCSCERRTINGVVDIFNFFNCGSYLLYRIWSWIQGRVAGLHSGPH